MSIPRAEFDLWYNTTMAPNSREKAYMAAEWGRAWQPASGPKPRLAVMVASDVVKLPSFNEWLDAVEAEGEWDVVLSTWAPENGYQDPERNKKCESQLAYVLNNRPACVVVVGNLARLAADYTMVDGHQPRCEWSHLYLSGHARWSDFTDVMGGGPGAAWMGNVSGDGRFDKLNPMNQGRRWPVFSIDFAYPYVDVRQPEVWPERTEMECLDVYFRRNLAYRRGEWVVPDRCLVNGSGRLLWPYFEREGIQEAAEKVGLEYGWDEDTRAANGKSARVIYGGFEPYLANMMYGLDVRAILHVQYKSFGMSRMHPSCSCHYFNERISLLSCWGRGYRVVKGNGHDFYMANKASKPVHFADVIYGDPTIRIV